MTFQERLAEKKKQIEGNLPPRYVKVMHGATKELKESGIVDQIIKIGETFPSFTMDNQKGVAVSSASLLEKGPLVITFYRGFWCPYCNIDLNNFKNYKPQIEAEGATLIAVSPELAQYSNKITVMQKIDFDILHDKDNELAGKLGIKFEFSTALKDLYNDVFHVNLKKYHASEAWELPMPSRFIIDKNGIVRYTECCPDYTKRPDPDDIIEFLKTMN